MRSYTIYILFECSRRESNEREGPKATLDRQIYTQRQIAQSWGPTPEGQTKTQHAILAP